MSARICPRCGRSYNGTKAHQRAAGSCDFNLAVDEVIRTAKEYHERGWQRAFHHSRFVRCVDLPLEYAPVRAQQGAVDMEHLLVKGPWVPVWAATCAGMPETLPKRKKVARFIADDPGVQAQLDCAWRLTGQAGLEHAILAVASKVLGKQYRRAESCCDSPECARIRKEMGINGNY